MKSGGALAVGDGVVPLEKGPAVEPVERMATYIIFGSYLGHIWQLP